MASFVAVKYGPLYHRHLEKDKTRALKENKGDFDRKMTVSAQSKVELKWWISHVDSAYNDVCCNDPDVVVTSDASLTGWGCVCEGVSSGGQWTSAEKSFHIHYLELKAALFALHCFQAKLKNKHVRLRLDNTTAVACIQHMGQCSTYPWQGQCDS